jgi:hypothetical protein
MILEKLKPPLLCIVSHLLAELSNPFLVVRTLLKIKNMKGSTLYLINDVTFAIVFISIRLIISPFLLLYLLEGDNVSYALKMGLMIVLYV